jgi:MFS family permease
VNWGVLYYAFGVLLLPVEEALGAPRWLVAGALSAALLVSALAAPSIGRRADRGHGPAVMRAGGVAAAILLAIWAARPHVVVHYAVWTGLGLCMAMVLYEPAFSVVGRAIADPHRRLRALAAVTIFGGLASTVFLPATAVLAARLGWRGAVWVLAGVLAISTLLVSRFTFEFREAAGPDRAVPGGAARAMPLRTHRLEITVLTSVFACASLASAGLTSNLVPLLVERQTPVTRAAWLAALLGVMQLPGRALLMDGRFSLAPLPLLAVSLWVQAAGLVTLLLPPVPLVMAAGVGLYAMGAGLTPLVRPHLVYTRYGLEQAGLVNGRMARAQQLARAGGPVLAAGIAGATGGYATFLLLFAVMLALLPVIVRLAYNRTSFLQEDTGDEDRVPQHARRHASRGPRQREPR